MARHKPARELKIKNPAKIGRAFLLPLLFKDAAKESK